MHDSSDQGMLHDRFLISVETIKKGVLFFMLLFSLIGYIPTLPYWLYNISFSLSLPFFFFIVFFSGYFRITSNEKIIFILFFFSFFFSYIFSDFPFNFAACLRGITPLFLYISVRTLNLKIDTFYINVLMIFLVLSFLFAFYEFFYLPSYKLDSSGKWVITNEGFYLLKRAGSFLGNENVFGVFTVISAIIIYTHKELLIIFKRPAYLYFLVIFNVFFLAKSRTSMLACFVCVIYWLIAKKRYKILYIILTVSGLLLFYLWSNLDHEIVDSIFRTSSILNDEYNSYSLRAEINKVGISLIPQNLLFGVGVGNEYLLMQSVNAIRPGVESASLNILLERGIYGYMLFLGLYLYFFIFSSSLTNRLLGLAILVVDFLETVFIYPQILSVIMIYLALYINSRQDLAYSSLLNKINKT